MKKFSLHLILAICLALPSFMITMESCSKDTETTEEGGHRPPSDQTGDENPTDDNSSSGSDESLTIDEEDPDYAIVGSWLEEQKTERLVFDSESRYEIYESEQDSGEWTLTESDYYKYDDLKRWLWLSHDDGNTVSLTEYRCIIKDDKLTLTESITGVKKEYAREK